MWNFDIDMNMIYPSKCSMIKFSLMKKNSVNENLENLCPNFPNCDSEEVLSQ